jgi:hypothetical protein
LAVLAAKLAQTVAVAGLVLAGRAEPEQPNLAVATVLLAKMVLLAMAVLAVLGPDVPLTVLPHVLPSLEPDCLAVAAAVYQIQGRGYPGYRQGELVPVVVSVLVLQATVPTVPTDKLTLPINR